MERKSIFHEMEIEIDEKNDIELLHQSGQEPEDKDRISKVQDSLQKPKGNKKEIGFELGLIDGYLLHKEFAGYNKKYYMIKDEKIFWSSSESNIRETKKVLEIKALKNCDCHKEYGFILVENYF